MTLQEALLSLGVAVAAGALVGAEREQARLSHRAGDDGEHADKAPHPTKDFGGIRTFPLIALLGGLSALLTPVLGLWALGLSLVATTALLAASYHRTSTAASPGLSTEFAALLTFVLGAMAGLPSLLPANERYLLVAAGAAITMTLLALRRPLHGFVAKVSADDVYATIKFVLLALVVVPILPDRTIGPLDVLNPQKVGLMIVLVAGVSFAGYVAARVVGSRRGLLVTGLLGGLAASTAVTLTFSGRARENPPLVSICAVAIMAACSIMFARILVVVTAVEPSLASAVALPLGAMAVTGLVVAGVLYRRSQTGDRASQEISLQNPFRLALAIKFGLLYAVVLFIAKAAERAFGRTGVLAGSLLAGTTDVDAITLSLIELHRGGLGAGTAATGITIAAIANTLVKGGMALVVGGWSLGKRVGAGLLVSLAAGGIVLLLQR